MDAGWIITLAASGGSAVGYIVKKVADHVLGRGKLKIDEATKIRAELRAERDRKDAQIAEMEVRKDEQIAALEGRKDKKIADLERRIDVLEDQLEKAEQRILDQERSKLAVYRTLVDYGANKELVNAVLAIQER